MMILAVLASFGLVVIAGIHLLWTLRIWWPVGQETELARTVVGTRGIEQMPSARACGIVVILLLLAAAWPWFPETRLKSLGLFAIAFTFQLRAIAAYSPLMKRLAPEQPFRSLDENLYAPICIFFGLVFMVLAGQSVG